MIDHAQPAGLAARRAPLTELRDPNAEMRDTGERYEMDEQGLTAYADYRRDGDRLFIDYVFSPVPCAGPARPAA